MCSPSFNTSTCCSPDVTGQGRAAGGLEETKEQKKRRRKKKRVKKKKAKTKTKTKTKTMEGKELPRASSLMATALVCEGMSRYDLPKDRSGPEAP